MDIDKFRVEIPDTEYWKKQIKCQYACPVHTDSRGYVRAIAEGDYEKAYLIARGPNPLASICGRICGAPCEAACRRADLDESVSIRALKRFVNERFGVVSGKYGEGAHDLFERFRTMGENECEDLEDVRNFLKHFQNQVITEDSPSVGIIGSGPAGLAAAHDLCLMGIKPVIYEMESVPAGMLYLGVPEYRLPRDLIKAEVEVIKALGTEIICGIKVGRDVSFSELRDRHQAVLIAVGAKNSRRIPLPNLDAPGVVGGVDFLRSVALKEEIPLGERVIVIGGGNVAYDVARTLIRQTEYDVSRTALRQEGVKEVHLVCLESLEEMPADTVEIGEGEEEGVIRHSSWGPSEILVNEEGHVRGVAFVRCLSVFDEKQRFAPRFDENETMVLEADRVFLSIGQETDLSFIDSDDVALNERGQLKFDSDLSRTEAEDVFAAGDVTYGPNLMINAIAAGKNAARSIYSFLKNEEIVSKTRGHHTRIKDYTLEKGYEYIGREGVPVLPPEERKKAMNLSVETGYKEEQSQRQAARCFNCAVNTIFDSDKCILCGGCADVCPGGCLKLVSLDRLADDSELLVLIESHYQGAPPPGAGCIIKDETDCIRCGLCAERCPVGAITMEIFSFQESFI